MIELWPWFLGIIVFNVFCWWIVALWKEGGRR